MKKLKTIIVSCCIVSCLQAQDFKKWAKTPPMGWNSYDCFGATVTEAEVKGNAKMMEVHLKEAGWEYIVIDYCWYYPFVGALNNPPQSKDFKPGLAMDEFGRLLPTTDRFPSAVNGKGFKELADYVHSLGLKFGIHVMRGIPREAVAKKMPIKGTNYTADQITNFNTCNWLNLMFGVDMTKPGGQEYYNSIFEMYANWGVDFVKVDDIASPYHEMEIEGIRKAIDRTGRPIVLSLSPGDETPSEKNNHLKANANMWRVSADFWDNWDELLHQFSIAERWQGIYEAGNWPDLDMIPFGILNNRGPQDGGPRISNFTLEEKYTLMTLWCITRSPLMYGGDLSLLRPDDLKLLNNSEIIAVNRKSNDNRIYFSNKKNIIWIAESEEQNGLYVAFFNISEKRRKIEFPVYEFFDGKVKIRDLWEQKEIGISENIFYQIIPPHGARIFYLQKI